MMSGSKGQIGLLNRKHIKDALHKQLGKSLSSTSAGLTKRIRIVLGSLICNVYDGGSITLERMCSFKKLVMNTYKINSNSVD